MHLGVSNIIILLVMINYHLNLMLIVQHRFYHTESGFREHDHCIVKMRHLVEMYAYNDAL